MSNVIFQRRTPQAPLDVADLPYAARLIVRRYAVAPAQARLVAELVGYSIASIAEARG